MVLNNKTAKLYSMLGQSGAAFGVGLIESEIDYPEKTIAISADMSKPAGLGKFSKLYPSRFYNVGIAEQNMVGLAAGFANEDYKPVVAAQACFTSMRSFEQIRQYSGYMKLPIVYVGVSSGFALTSFGNTHYALEDVALLSTVPGMVIVSPSDASQAVEAMKQALRMDQSVYIRCTGIPNLPPIYTEDYDFEIGKAITVLDKGDDVVIFVSGSITRNVIEAVRLLVEKYTVKIRVVDFHTLSPLDLECLDDNLGAKLWISVEEHFITGGLGSLLANYIATKEADCKPLLSKIGVDNKYTIPGDYSYLLEQNGLSSNGLFSSFEKMIKKFAYE